MSMAARDTVLCMPELLELILARLPMRDLLVTAPLVSKAWQATTLTPVLQRALFFQPDPSPTEPVRNPLLAEMFPPFFTLEGQNPDRWPGTASALMSMPWAKASDAFRRKDASWRRMLVVQPTVRVLRITETSRGLRGIFERRAVLKLKDQFNLNMGLLYDLAVPLISRVPSVFCIHWHNGLACQGKDLTLAIIYAVDYRPRPQTFDERFHSDARKEVQVKFGAWVPV
ncbi:putative MFS transporter [Mycena venus]|uniref:Putative MFS transporter n=1 Tax=Mycena venus TaxID=2733690 RepID=A0A8H7CB59_9AGAR|nr:putative MFS transporter [Mycena venus]